MSKIADALRKILPANQVAEVTSVVESMMARNNEALKAEYKTKLEESYEDHEDEKRSLESIMEQGYQQAYEIISDLQHRLDTQREEFETALEEGFEEAYKELQKEKSKNTDVEVELYDEFDGKLREMKEFMVDKIDRFLSLQEREVYESAKRDVLNDPRMLEHRVTLEKITEAVSDYLSTDVSGVSAGKLEKAYKMAEELKGQMKIMESRNMRLTMQNNKLNEQVKEANGLLTEAARMGRTTRTNSRTNASGRGQRAMGDQILTEYANPEARHQRTVNEGVDNPLNDLLVLSGIPTTPPEKKRKRK